MGTTLTPLKHFLQKRKGRNRPLAKIQPLVGIPPKGWCQRPSVRRPVFSPTQLCIVERMRG